MNPSIVLFIIAFGLQQQIANYRHNQRFDQNLKQSPPELQDKFIREIGISLDQFVIVTQPVTVDIIKINPFHDDIQKPNFRTELFLPTYQTNVVEDLNQKQCVPVNPYTQLSFLDMKKLPNFQDRFYNGPNVNNLLLFEYKGIIHLIQGIETEESYISQLVGILKMPFNGILYNQKKAKEDYKTRIKKRDKRHHAIDKYCPRNREGLIIAGNRGDHTHALAYKSNRNAMVIYKETQSGFLKTYRSVFLEIYDFETNQQNLLTSIDLKKYSEDEFQLEAHDLFFVGGNILFLKLWDKLYKIILPKQKDYKSDTDIAKETLFQKVADNVSVYAIDSKLPIGFIIKKSASFLREDYSHYPVYAVNLTTGKYKQIADIDARCPGCMEKLITPSYMAYDGYTLGIGFSTHHACPELFQKDRELLATIPLSIYKLPKK